MTPNYTVILESEPTGGYHVFCPALKGCHSEGETEEEALELYSESLIAHRQPVPEEQLQVRSVPVAV